MAWFSLGCPNGFWGSGGFVPIGGPVVTALHANVLILVDVPDFLASAAWRS